MTFVKNQHVHVRRRSLAKHGEVLDVLEAQQPVVVILSLSQQMASHGRPSGLPSVLSIQFLGNEVRHHSLSATRWRFEQDRLMSILNGIKDIGDNPLLVIPYF
jgi:hypothetical protein